MSRPPADEWSRTDRGQHRRRSGTASSPVEHASSPGDDPHRADDGHHDDLGHPDDVEGRHGWDDALLFDEAHPGDTIDGHDESLADDVLAAHGGDDDNLQFRPRRRRRRSPVVRWLAILCAVAVVLVGGYYGVRAIGNVIPSFDMGSQDPADYTGAGTGEVSVVIPAGAGGSQIGQILADADVVASSQAFADAAASDPRSTGIQPGTYTMATQMSASAALERLFDPTFRQVNGVTIREGLWKEEVFAILAEKTDTPLKDYEKVDPDDLDLPKAADGDMEGFLFPDTYDFDPNATAQEQLKVMVEHGKDQYDKLDVKDGDELRTLIIEASLVQAEGFGADDLPKIARVIQNRLDDDEALGFDSTVHFMFKERGRAGTTDAQRHTEDPYNTYLNTGLPPGPINSPGLAAIEAAMNPADGSWKYFVTVNPSTGETRFADTFEEHQKNEKLFQKWCKDNPDSC